MPGRPATTWCSGCGTTSRRRTSGRPPPGTPPARPGTLDRDHRRVVGPHRRAVACGGWTRMASVRAAKRSAIAHLQFSAAARAGRRRRGPARRAGRRSRLRPLDATTADPRQSPDRHQPSLEETHEPHDHPAGEDPRRHRGRGRHLRDHRDGPAEHVAPHVRRRRHRGHRRGPASVEGRRRPRPEPRWPAASCSTRPTACPAVTRVRRAGPQLRAAGRVGAGGAGQLQRRAADPPRPGSGRPVGARPGRRRQQVLRPAARRPTGPAGRRAGPGRRVPGRRPAGRRRLPRGRGSRR